MLHETLWKSKAAGESAPACPPALKIRQTYGRGGKQFEDVRGFRVSLAAGLPTDRITRLETETGVGTSAQTLPASEGKTFGASAGGFSGPRLRHGSVDPKSRGASDPQIFRGGISPVPCLETSDQFGSKLSETGAESPAKRRGSHRTLETLHLAAYKKTPRDSKLTWSFSTKVDSCSSLTSNGLGHFGDRHLRFATFTNRTGFRLLTRWSFPPRGSDWLSMSECAPITSMAWTSGRFCGIFSSIFAGRFSFFGIVEPSTSAWKFGNILTSVIAFTSNGSPHMRPNSTRRNMSGAKTTRTWPTALRSTSASLRAGSTIPCAEFAAHKNYYGRASMPPTCRGLVESLYYLCNVQ